jgi:hypothetical protein
VHQFGPGLSNQKAAQNTGGHYKSQSDKALRIRRGRSVLCSSGCNGRLQGKAELSLDGNYYCRSASIERRMESLPEYLWPE